MSSGTKFNWAQIHFSLVTCTTSPKLSSRGLYLWNGRQAWWSSFKKGDQRVCSNYWEFTCLSLPGKVNSRVLVRRIRQVVKLRIQEEQCAGRPGYGTLDHLYTLHRAQEFTGVRPTCPHVLCGFVDLEIMFDVFTVVVCGSWGVWGSGQSLYARSVTIHQLFPR